MQGLKLKIFYSPPTKTESLFNHWVATHPEVRVVDAKLAIDPNPQPGYAGDLVLLVFYVKED